MQNWLKPVFWTVQKEQLALYTRYLPRSARKELNVSKLKSTLEYRINVQQILSKFWILAQLHACFVLHNSEEKKCGAEFVFYHLFATYMLIRSTRLFGTSEYLRSYCQLFILWVRHFSLATQFEAIFQQQIRFFKYFLALLSCWQVCNSLPALTNSVQKRGRSIKLRTSF